jgi:hypothetical protein
MIRGTPMTPEQELAYLAAFIDGEGWITFWKFPNRNKFTRQIGFTNTNEQLFRFIVELAERAGLTFSIRHVKIKNEKHSDRWNAMLLGGKAAYARFESIVPLMHPDKKIRLNAIMDCYENLELNGRQRSAPIYDEKARARRSEISRMAVRKRWGSHVPKQPRMRALTEEQKAHRNLLARQRRIS